MTTSGIRFYPSSISVDSHRGTPSFMHGTVEEKRSDFDLIFERLYPFWKDFVFLDDSSLFRYYHPELSDEEERQLADRLESYVIAVNYDRYRNARKLMKGSVFPEFGKFVYEFEGAGFCLLEPGTSIDAAVKLEEAVWRKVSLEKLPAGVVCLLQNWDGIFWQIFSRDPAYLEILQSAHGGSKVVPAYWVELVKDFPNPRGSSPEEVGMMRVEAIDPAK